MTEEKAMDKTMDKTMEKKRRFPVEVRFVYPGEGDSVVVHDGIYVFSDTTLDKLYRLADMSEECGVRPMWVEMELGAYERGEKEDSE